MMFHYKVWFKDTVYGEICKANGRIHADSASEARTVLRSFYEEVQHITITPILIETKQEYDKEWDI